MLVHDFLINSAERFPRKTALVCGEQRYSYADILAQSSRLAAALGAMGLQRRDRVVIFLENSVETVVALFGTLMAGGTFIILNPAVRSRKLAYIINNSGARVFISAFDKPGMAREAAAAAPALGHVVWAGRNLPADLHQAGNASEYTWDSALAGAPFARPANVIDADLAAIIYTSGTTGEPKGVMSAHCNMASAARSINAYLQHTPDDIILNHLSLSYGYGLYQLLTGFQAGSTVVLERSFTYPYRVLEKLEKERATGMPITPTVASILLQMKGLARFDLTSLRYLTNAAAALPVPHLRRLMTIFPHVSFFSMYGLTECTRVCYMPPAELARRPDSVGIAMPNCEAYVVDERGNEVATGQVGELVVRGNNVNQGYWEAPEETAERFRTGRYRGDVRLHTGDLFRRDEEGYLYFVARKDDLIKTKGERVSPKEVENVLCEMEGVTEAAVVGVPDELLGQAIKAFVVWSGRGEASAAAVLHHCKRHLEPFMIPRKVEFRDLLPRTSSGKIDKMMLKKMREAGGGKREARS